MLAIGLVVFLWPIIPLLNLPASPISFDLFHFQERKTDMLQYPDLKHPRTKALLKIWIIFLIIAVPARSRSSENPVPVEETIQQLLQENTRQTIQQLLQENKEISLCVCCRERNKEVVYIPCGHFLYCYICDNLKYHSQCPICQQRIRGFVHVQY